MRAPTAPRAPSYPSLSRKPLSLRPRRPEAEAQRPEESPRKEPKTDQVPRWFLLEAGGGTYPEYLVWKWLRDKGYQPGIDFQFQSSFFGGRMDLGGLVADFVIDALTPPLVIRVQGDYWHTLPGRRTRDFYEMIRLQEHGFDVVDVWETDVVNRLNFTMEQALKGVNLRDMARTA